MDKSLGKRIQYRRKLCRLTQLQLADSLHISHQSVSKWERGESTPDTSFLPELAKILDASLDWLLLGDDPFQDQLDVTIFVSSIRNFAKTAASLSPKETVLILNNPELAPCNER